MPIHPLNPFWQCALTAKVAFPSCHAIGFNRLNNKPMPFLPQLGKQISIRITLTRLTKLFSCSTSGVLSAKQIKPR